MEMHALLESGRADALPEGRALGRACAVVQFEFGARRRQGFRHRQDRRHADAARQQQRAPAPTSGKWFLGG
jgi:hypothetical protein